MSDTQNNKEDKEANSGDEYSSSNYSSSSQSSFEGSDDGEQAEDMDVDEGTEPKKSSTQSASQMTFKHSESAQKSAFGKVSACQLQDQQSSISSLFLSNKDIGSTNFAKKTAQLMTNTKVDSDIDDIEASPKPHKKSNDPYKNEGQKPGPIDSVNNGFSRVNSNDKQLQMPNFQHFDQNSAIRHNASPWQHQSQPMQ